MESSVSNLQATPLKNKTRKIKSSYTDKIIKCNTIKNMATDQAVTNNIQETNIQFSPTKENKIDGKVLRVEAISNTQMSTDICKNKEIKHIDDIQNNLDPLNISPMKMSNMHSTPKKLNDYLHNFDNANCNNKINDNSLNDKNIYSLCLRELQDLMKSPPSKKTGKLLQSDNAVPTNENLEKINKNNDYEQFCNTIQSELHNSENCNSFEAVDFIHDDLLNTMINTNEVEDTKVSDILASSMPNISTLQYTDDSLVDFKEDPLTDPLFISDHEEKDIDTALMDSDYKPPALKRPDRLCKRQTKNYSNNIKRHKLNTEGTHILKELENIKEELPLSAIQQLESLCIKLVHKVPPQHKVETTGAHNITREEKILFQKYGPLRQGSYSPTEDKMITQNWNTFCKLHDWDSKNIEPFLHWRHNGKYYIRDLKERQKFVQFLANGLPWRTLYSIYSRFKILYNNKITNIRYTPKEDKKILTYIKNAYLDKRSTKYIELAKLLRRTNRSISKRYKYLQRTLKKNKLEKSNIKWTLLLIKKFIKTLLSVTKSDDVEELKDVAIPMPVWQKVGEKLNTDGKTLKIFWQHQLHLQLFSTSPIYLNNIKIQLIEYMYTKEISNTREIIWPNIAQHIDGTTAVFLCKIFFYLVQECDVNNKDNFSDVVEYLYHKKIPEIKNSQTDKFLPRIVYKHGKIDVLE